MIIDAEDISSVPFHFLYDPQVLRFEGGSEGPFMGGGGDTAFFAVATSGGGEVVVGLSRLGGDRGVSGSGELCTLRFTVVGSGNAGLAFARAKVKDQANRMVPSTFKSASVDVR